MALPKRKQSHSRSHKRRANFKLVVPHLVECPHCHALKALHTACRKCGYYNGRQVIAVEKKPA